ncbi:MAG: monovalent cation/H+ antiporter complex subunit F [Methanoregula sp.]|nr:monovalent cation/H+ antiporter complex subunit F [Methanoregula sp.]
MIDTWFFAALCFGFLALCALLRVIPGPGRNDRIVSFTAAITLAFAAALVLSIAYGDLFILDAAILLALLLFAGTIGYEKFCGGNGQ